MGGSLTVLVAAASHSGIRSRSRGCAKAVTCEHHDLGQAISALWVPGFSSVSMGETVPGFQGPWTTHQERICKKSPYFRDRDPHGAKEAMLEEENRKLSCTRWTRGRDAEGRGE